MQILVAVYQRESKGNTYLVLYGLRIGQSIFYMI